MQRFRFAFGCLTGFIAGGVFAAAAAAFLVNYYPEDMREVAQQIQDFRPSQLDGLFEPQREPVDVDAIVADAGGDVAINIMADAEVIPFNDEMLGGNLPAWLNPTRFKTDEFIEKTAAAEISLIRIPGGSWSNWYDWLACERDGEGIDDQSECSWPWASTPSDYMRFAQAVDGEFMYTVRASNGATAQDAAALVAFFNGDPSDTTEIGMDQLGRDWGTVGQWAQLRVDRGFTDPITIEYWEIGNEFYGGKEGLGTDCQDYGWETVWTCDGTEYVTGIEGFDGYLDYYDAMKAVDPTIQIGIVGVTEQAEWSNWGNEVLATAGDKIDFYVMHQYGFSGQPNSNLDVVAAPFETWPTVMADYNEALQEHANGRDIPVAVTEYNLFSFQGQDDGQLMTRVVNAMYIADSIGQMALSGVDMANHWDIANGQANNGTDYGLVSADGFDRSPQYYVFPLWARFGNNMHPVESPFPADTALSVYSGSLEDGRYTLFVINKTGTEITTDLQLNGEAAFSSGEAYVVKGQSLESKSVLYNGVANPSNDLSSAPPIQLDSAESFSFEPFSMTVLVLDQ